MKTAIASLVCLGLLGACERDREQRVVSPPPRSKTATQVSAESRATVTDYVAYLESVLVIMREHGKDCDVAAKQLEGRLPLVLDLASRIQKSKDAVGALPEPERTEVKQETETVWNAFTTRNPDVDAIMERAKACAETSSLFAEIGPKVIFTRKKQK